MEGKHLMRFPGEKYNLQIYPAQCELGVERFEQSFNHFAITINTINTACDSKSLTNVSYVIPILNCSVSD